MIELGWIVRDKITGFTGMATSRHTFLTGCDRIGVSPVKLTKDGEILESQSFDESFLEVVKKQKPPVSKAQTTAAPGGPRSLR